MNQYTPEQLIIEPIKSPLVGIKPNIAEPIKTLTGTDQKALPELIKHHLTHM